MPEGKPNLPVIPLYPLTGKEDLFASLFREYYPALCYFAHSIIYNEEEAKDIVQDSFVKLWDSLSFTQHTDTVRSFLYTTVRNKCIDLLRKRKVISKAKAAALHNDEADPGYFDEAAFAEMLRLVFIYMQELPATMQEVLKLHFLEGKRFKEIATELHSTPDAVRMQKDRAIKIIRKKLLFILFFLRPF